MSQETLKQALSKTIANIQKNPGVSRVVFRAETRLEQDVRCSANVRDFAEMGVDEPVELGGGNTAMNPVELVLVALGTCQEIMYAAYASVMGIPLEDLKVSVKGNLDFKGLFGLESGVPAGFQKITYETRIKSPADEASIVKLIEAAESHCPLLDTLVRPVEVSGKVIINGTREVVRKLQPEVQHAK